MIALTARIPRPTVPWLTIAAVSLLFVAEATLGYATNDPRLLTLYLVGLVGLMLATATLLRPDITVYALLFLLFTRLSDVYGPQSGLLTANQLLVSLFLAATLLYRLVGRRVGLVTDRLLGWMLIFAAAIGLSGVGAVRPGAAVTELVGYLREVVILFLLLNLVTSLAGLRLATWTLVVAGGFLAAMSGLYLATGYDLGGLAGAYTGHIAGETFGGRLQGPVGDPNEFARLLVIVVPLAVYRAWEEPGLLLRLAALGAAALISLVIALTFSRGGILALLVVLAIPVLRGRIRPGYLVAVAITVGVIALAAPQSYWLRLQALVQYASGTQSTLATEDASLQERWSLVQIGALMFLDHPIAGVGKGSYLVSYPSYAWRIDPSLTGTPKEAHSLPVQIAAETGLVGLGSLGAVVIVALASLRAARRRLDDAGLRSGALLAEAIEVGMWGYMVASLFLSDSYPRYLWLLVGLAMIARQVALRVAPEPGRHLWPAAREGRAPGSIRGQSPARSAWR